MILQISKKNTLKWIFENLKRRKYNVGTYYINCLSKFKRFSESLAFKDQQCREKAKLINEVSQLANGVTDSMSELQDVQESVLDMKKFLNQCTDCKKT